MDIARHVFERYFQDNTNPLVRHHLDSFSDLLSTKIPNFIRGKNPLALNLAENRIVHVYIGGKDGKAIRYSPPVDELGNAILPHMCRLSNMTYSLQIRVDIEIEYIFADKSTETKRFENVLLGKVPLMLKSSLCYLAPMTSDEMYEAGECRFEPGGYFIINGSEKVLLTQERLGDNMFYGSKRKIVSASNPAMKTLVEKEGMSKVEGATREDDDEYIAGVKSISEDGTLGPYSHFLIIPPGNIKPNDPEKIQKEPDYSVFSTKRLAIITLPGFTQPVPLMSVFYALGLTSDQDIYDTILAGIPHKERSQYDELFMELVLSHQDFAKKEMLKEEDQSQDPDLLFLRRQTRTRSNGGIYMNLYDLMFPHCEQLDNESSAAFYRRKSYLLGYLVRLGMDVALGITQKSDRDHFRFKRFDASGDLCFQEFRRVYNEVSKRMMTEIDKKVHFQQQEYRDKKVADLVQDENINYYWHHYEFLDNFEKSFKKQWGGKDGISQELSRYSYLGTLAHLRRINLQMDKGTKSVEPRRIHCSSWGLVCPTDNPDGHNIGMIKSLTVLSSVSTASPFKTMFDIVSKFEHFLPTSTIHPSSWNSVWTRVFINSDLVGVFTQKSDEYHSILLKKRRKQEINKYVSLCWNRLNNEYIIFTDAGRPCRPIYQEGVSQSDIRRSTKWSELVEKYMDYVDAQETESLRISMIPFSPTKPSEIHGLAIFSASASAIPNSDCNQAPRNMFSCQQTKQACAIFNTAFNKRFDTIATILNYAQRPLSQTWTVPYVLGKNGCLPYGENPIVALAIYSGYNQEDSVLLNEASLNRGMFHTTYYHSYDITEDMIDFASKAHTEFANIATNPKYRESVSRNEGYNYDLLDGDGIIRKGVEINDKTILVGIVNPKLSLTGETLSYMDVSYKPKRGQTGMVDAVYRYITAEGLRGVKIRVAEKRVPVLGDKFSARHGQKGTCGMRIREEDMPFTAGGIRPDMIVNPHAFPSRMTIGQFIEMMSTKLGVYLGCLVDSTPFSAKNRVGEVKDLLTKNGYHPYGHEIMYNGQSGEMMEAEIFMGPTYYLRLKQMVEDKINYRGTGPKKLLTHQPVEGRANDGGLRIGEMERDALLSHGMSKFLNESLMERSDKAELIYEPEKGVLDSKGESEVVKLTAPYTLGVYMHEIESMHVSVKLLS